MGEVILNFNKKTIGKIIIYKNTNNKLKKNHGFAILIKFRLKFI